MIPAPKITTLAPSTTVHNADTSITITGTGFYAGATVNVGVAFGLVPTNISPTSIVVPVKAINIALAGTLAVSVQNADGQSSNSLNLTVT